MAKKKLYLFFIIILAIVLGYSSIYHIDTYAENPFNRAKNFNNPIFATSDSSSNMYIIDDSMKRVVKIDKAGNVSFILTGGESSNLGFYTALELDVDSDGNIYLLNNVLDVNGQYVEKEEIIRYTSEGRYKDVVYSIEYEDDERPMRTGNISSIFVQGDYVYYYSKQLNSISFIRTSIETKQSEIIRSIDYDDANNMIVDFATSHDSLDSFFTTKRGEIYKIEENGFLSLIYSGSDASSESIESIPWEVEVDAQDNLYFTDLIQRSIRCIDPSGNISTVLSHEILEKEGYDNHNAVFYRISFGEDDAINTIGNENVISYNKSDSVNFFGSGYILPLGSYLGRFLLWIQLVVLAAAIFYIINCLVDVFRNKPPKVLIQSLFIIIVICVSTVFASSTIFNSFEQRYEDEIINRIEQAMHLTSRSIDGDVFERIQKPEHFMNDDYKHIREQLHSAFNDNLDPWGEGFYGALYTVSEGKPYAIMYYDDSKCPFYPLYEDGSEQEYIDVFYKNAVITSKSSDAEGDWLYGLTPVYNSAGDVVGILEIGTDLYSFKQENDKLKRDVLIDTVTLLIVLVFATIEITILGDVISRRRAQQLDVARDERRLTGLDVLMIRPICFLIYAACYLSGSFVPILMKQLYTEPIWGIPENIVYALPLSAESLFLSMSSLLGGYVIDKKGWKPTFLVGLSVLFAGQTMSALSVNPLLFIIARSVSGMGMGLTFISMQSFVVLPSTEEERNDGISALNSGGYAGLNAGLIIGGVLAERIGFSNVYFCSAAVVAICILISVRTLKNAKGEHEVDDSAEIQGGVASFFLNPNILAFFLLIFIPVIICTMFNDYFFPLFAEAEGMSTASISRSLLLNGLSIIYLGPMLSKYIAKHVGSRMSMLLACLIAATALVQFALIGTMLSALTAILLLGIAESFGITSRVNYFSSTEAVAKLGRGKALGYYGLVENIGQVIGPIVYGLVIGLGIFKGIGIIGIGFLIMIALFSMITIRKDGIKKKNLSRKQFSSEL